MKPRFEVAPLSQGDDWLIVADLGVENGDVAALFPKRYAEEAQEFADRLNIRELAGRG